MTDWKQAYRDMARKEDMMLRSAIKAKQLVSEIRKAFENDDAEKIGSNHSDLFVKNAGESQKVKVEKDK